RQRARQQHAALHRLQQFGEMPVAVVEARWRVGDADDGPAERIVGITLRLGEGAAEIGGELRVAVVGGPPGDAAALGTAGHAPAPCARISALRRSVAAGSGAAPAITTP